MAKLEWDNTGQRFYETGVDRGVLYLPDASGAYNNGYAWNGLTTVTESPSGAEANAQYADNIKYLNLISAEEFGATIEAFTWPREFEQCDGTANINGVNISQQIRKNFGLSYRTLLGNDTGGNDYAYKIHMVYNALAAPSEKAYATVNDSPEAITFSWELTTTPTTVGTINGVTYKPTATVTVDTTRVTPAALKTLEDTLYGTEGTTPRLPTPAEVIALFAAGTTAVTPDVPAWASATKEITIPTNPDVSYYINGVKIAGGQKRTATTPTVVYARPNAGKYFANNVVDAWLFG